MPGGGGGHGGGGHGGGHGGGGSRGSHGGGGFQGKSYNVISSDNSNWQTPILPVLTYEDGVRPSFDSCVCQNIRHCHRNFNGEGMRACIHGMLLNNDLLPFGVAGGVMDVEGGFAGGMSLPICTSITQTSDLIPQQD